MSLLLVSLLTVVLTVQAQAPAGGAACDRKCLADFVTKYLNSLLTHKPSDLPTSDKVRFTEDTVEMKVGEGLWKTASKLRPFRQEILDVRWGVAGVHAVVEENGTPVMLAARLKIVDRKVTEIETMVVRNQAEGMIFNIAAVKEATPAMNILPEKSKLQSREEMIRIASLYPGGLKVGSFVTSGAPFAPEAYRFENGQLMAGPGCTFIAGCDNIKGQRLPTLSEITYRVGAVDEEQGIVWLRQDFGRGSVMGGGGGARGGAPRGGGAGGPGRGAAGPPPGGNEFLAQAPAGPPQRGGAPAGGANAGGGSLTCWEMFKIYGGEIHAVEAFMKVMPLGTPSGWDSK
jgi:hypothetical protein